MAELRMDWPDGMQVRTEDFHLPSRPVPKNHRDIGETVGGRKVTVAYSNPIWTMRLRCGPLPRASTRLLRTRVGQPVTVRLDIPERPRAAYPSAEIWMNANLAATLTASRPRAFGADIAQGDVWDLTLQFAESGIT